MPNIKSAKKRMRSTVRRTQVTAVRRHRVATLVRKCEATLQSSEPKEAEENFRIAVSELARGASRGVIPRRRAARKTSRLALRFGKITASAATAEKS